MLVSPFNIFSFIIWSAAEVWTIAHIVAPEFGVQPGCMYLVFAVPVAIYMWMGGFHAVINSNVLQFFMAIIFVTIVIVVHGRRRLARPARGVSMYDYLSSVMPPGSGEGVQRPGASFSLGVPFIFISHHRPAARVGDRGGLVAQGAVGEEHASGAQGIWANLVLQHHLDAHPAEHHRPLRRSSLYPPATASTTALGGDAYQLMPVFLSRLLPDLVPLVVFCLMAGALSIVHVATFTNVCALNISYDVLQPLVYRQRGWSDAKIVPGPAASPRAASSSARSA